MSTINVKFVENKGVTRNGENYTATEVYFSEKPSATTLTALKTLKFRWNPTKHAWYGFLTVDEVKDVLRHPQNAQALAEKKADERAKAREKAKKSKSTDAKAQTKSEKSTDAKKSDKPKCSLTAQGKAVVANSKKSTEPELNFDDITKATKAPKESAKGKGKK